VEMFERRMALLEGAEACHATASGMAAVFAALMAQLKTGDHVVSSRALFGSCFFILGTLLPRWGIEVTFVDGHDLDQWQRAIGAKTRVVFFETPANPTIALVDIAKVSELAHRVGAKVVIDNVFATPLLQKPLKLGADVVVYSATKHIDGQGRCLGGAVLADAQFCKDQVMPFLRHTGPALSPFNAWVLVKGLETLGLRLERQCVTTRRIAEQLSGHRAVARTLYPTLPSHPQYELARRQMTDGGSVVSFELKGGKAAAFAFMNALEIVDISNNLGDSKSLVTHPATTTHRAMGEEARLQAGITQGLTRLSIGLESPDDLARDVERGLAAAAAVG
ncbi:MAG: aminotransferase class V-fold PLP-dependent enzyme, partial [Proteobacteria bacterium]|nr:aminotransferase class V-fold PLP-dependent enzyme [Pseudomonadota bacterium]